MLRLEAVVQAGGTAIDDPALRWTVVALDREETVLGGEAVARPELVEIPGGHIGNIVFAGAFERIFQPLAVIENIETFMGVVEGCLSKYRAAAYGPIADIVYFCHVL